MSDERQPKADGRKRKASQKRQRSFSIEIALTSTERAEIERRAADAGLSLSSFSRAAALGDPGPRAARRPTVEAATLASVHAELKRVGNNVNQIAKALNSGHRVLLPEVQKAHEELSLILFEVACAFGYKMR